MSRQIALVNVEGTNGVGKTRLSRQAAERLGPRCVPLVELPDAPPAGLPGQVIAALHQDGDLFLRTGHPRTETLLLMGLQVHRFESLGPVTPGQVVLEDRGPHSVAIYQAAVLAETEQHSDEQALTTAWHILSTIESWRPQPTATILLFDDPRRCLQRFEQRIGRTATASERSLMDRADRLYRLLAHTQQGQYYVLDRQQVDEPHAVAFITDVCQRAAATATPKGAVPCPTGT